MGARVLISETWYYIAAEFEKWDKVVRVAGIKPD